LAAEIGWPQKPQYKFLADRTFGSLEQAQAELDAWVGDYNTVRPHQALDMATPAERLALAQITLDGASVPVPDRPSLASCASRLCPRARTWAKAAEGSELRPAVRL